MTDDWGWFWANENRRDEILKDEIEGLQSSAAAAQARSSRLSSQLARVQGSLESRLKALSAAFDAYVELGDVREQLAGYPDTTAIRRDVGRAIEALSGGRAVDPIDPRGVEYWLPYAMNAVLALAHGGSDPASEAKAKALDRGAELFIVATAGGLGHGAAVADRVAALLVCDGSLTPAQQALWQAVAGGEYGDLLPQIRPLWADSMTAADARSWSSWISAAADESGPEPALAWLERFVSDDFVASKPAKSTDQSQPDARTGLRAVVSDLVAEGIAGERELLQRSRELRRRIEAPDSAGPVTTPAAPSVAVVDAVRQTLLTTSDPTTRMELVGWVQTGLQAAVARLVSDAAQGEPTRLTARTPGGDVAVNASGPDRLRMAEAEQNVRNYNAPPRARLLGWGSVAAVLAALALVIVLTSSTDWAIVFLLGAVACVGMALLALRDRAAAGRRLATDLASMGETIRAAVNRAVAADQARAAAAREIADLGGRVSTELRRLPVAVSPTNH